MAKYLLRLDDASHHMNMGSWLTVLTLCDKYNIKPVIAVIPFVEDPELLKYGKIENFWDLAREWQTKNYSIGLHGYNHKYESKCKGLITPRNKSEFSGLSESDQKRKILLGLEKFKQEGIKTILFIAPGHSFDLTTIKVLIDCGIEYIYDGFFRDSIKYLGIKWIPQQLWVGKKANKGTWTICLHPNTINDNELLNLEQFISENSDKFINKKDVVVVTSCYSRTYNIFRNFVVIKKNYLKFWIKEVFLDVKVEGK
jgi:predicted deacetylase